MTYIFVLMSYTLRTLVRVYQQEMPSCLTYHPQSIAAGVSKHLDGLKKVLKLLSPWLRWCIVPPDFMTIGTGLIWRLSPGLRK